MLILSSSTLAVDKGADGLGQAETDERSRSPPAGKPRLRSRAWRVAAIYAVFATLWILFSDRALGLLAPDPDALVRWSVYKGIAFVAVTSVLLLMLMRRAFGSIEAGYARLRANKNEIERFNRLYAALSQINQGIVLSPNRDALFSRICEALVAHGGFQMAWIGWRPSPHARLEPVAVSGSAAECIDRIAAHGNDSYQGREIWRTVFDDGAPLICNNLKSDAASPGWGAEPGRHGLLAAAAVPIREQGAVRGVLNVYANETGFFRDKEIALLREAAQDVSYALDKFALAEERRRAEAVAAKETEFSRAMIDSTPGILYFYDERGKFLRWNQNFEDASGYSGEEIASMHPVQFFPDEYRTALDHGIARVFETGQASIEAPFLTKDGTRIPYFFTGRRVVYDGLNCLVGMGIDISERKEAEVALRELNENLENMVAERTAELHAAVARAEAADRLKSAFLATMSHELRTPLNSIIGFTGIVLQELAGPLTSEQRKQLGMVQDSARHLLDLINDVLDISKIEAGQLEVRAEPFDLQACIDRVVALTRPQADSKHLELSTEAPPSLPGMVGDPRRVQQVLINLLSNAVKFTEQGGVTLKVDLLNDSDEPPDATSRPMVRFRVYDTGIGIAPEDLSALFQPFHQVDTGLTRQHEGTGLGLAICRRLTELMGGQITAASRPGKGSEFTVTLPLDATEQS